MPEEEIAVISPYRRQNNCVRRAISTLAKKRNISLTLSLLTVDTVERIQGGEKEIVIVSLTSSDESHLQEEEEFFFSPGRFNVALTRAKQKLFLLGSPVVFRYIPSSLKLGVPLEGEFPLPPFPSLVSEEEKRLWRVNLWKRWYWHHRERGHFLDGTRRAKELCRCLGFEITP